MRQLMLCALMTLCCGAAQAAPVFEKVRETAFTKTDTTTEVREYTLTDLRNDRAIYVQQIAEYQAKIDAVDALLAEAEKLGIVEEGG